MSLKSLFSSEYFPSLHNREQFFDSVLQEKNIGIRILNQYLLLIGMAFLYGIIMGVYQSLLQALTAGIKVALLFSLVIIICFPAFYIIQFILGSKLKIGQVISIILSGFILATAIMISFMPIVVIFLLTGSNYYFLQLLHIAIFIFSGIFGMATILEALKYSCEKKAIYPKTGVVVFRFWVIILAFVGIQLAWNFRPFMGKQDEPFALTRQYEGNFYEALIYSANQLFSGDEAEPDKSQPDASTDIPW